ncbi:MAG TPA: diguanylate cyclase [Tepidisphaeraceae bacterium]|nr:diguanylate cyclase [Tepidisphaeraceae bacterium]
MRRFSTATRLSIGLCALTVSLLVGAEAIGLIPSATAADLRGRKDLCEAIAIHCSEAARMGDIETIRRATEQIVSRNPGILSAAVRRSDGFIAMQVGDHAAHWKAPPGDESTPANVRVPIFAGDSRWGTVEVTFRGSADGWRGMVDHPLVRLTVFVAGASFLGYFFYLRRSLQHLDPSAVIPERVRTMLDTLAEGVLVLDKQQRIVLANQAFAAAVGQPAEDLQGVPAARFGWTSPQAEDAAGNGNLPWAEALRSGSTRTGVALCLKRGEEDTRMFTVNCAPITGGAATVRGALVTFDDVTSIEKKNAQLRKTLDMLKQSRDEINRQNQELQALATTDPLTGCLNRRSFFAQFESHWSSAKRYGYALSCVMVDVDRFKSINDRYGHSVGDQVLQHVATILRSLARDGDLVCRYGGEEFCVLLTHTDLEGAAQAAERYREAIETRACGGVSATASLGVSGLEAGAQSPQRLIDEADKALYAAKQTGRNRVARWDQMPEGATEVGKPIAAAAGERAEEQTVAAPARAAQAPPADHAADESQVPYRAVTALSSALKYRDAATAAHSQRVADLAVATAEGLMSASECFLLEVAALLHDIGKLGVPDAILLKPGALTDEEWKVMRLHDRMGAEIVAAAFGSDELTEIVQTHHAWFGGSPKDPGLPRGENIPLRARILSICDAYDAMVTDRVYRKGRSPEEAFAELRRFAGKQFDPRLVERFVSVVTRLGPDDAAGAFPSEAAEAVDRVREQVERMARALEAQDMSMLRAMASRLAATAGRDGLGEVAQVATALERCASPHPDVLDVVSKVNELMELVKSAAHGTNGHARPHRETTPMNGASTIAA